MKNSSLYSIILFPLFLIIFTTIIILTFSHNNVKTTIDIYSSHLLDEYNKFNKSNIHNIVQSIKKSIEYDTINTENILKLELKDKLEMAMQIVNKIYNSNKEKLTTDEIRTLIIDNLSHFRFDSQEGYFFVFDLKTNYLLGHPTKEFIGLDFSNHKDINGKLTLVSLKKSLEKNRFAFEKIYFYKPNNNEIQYPKLNSGFKFEPLNLIIGTGEYLDAVEERQRKEEIFKIKTISDKNDIKVNVYTLNADIEFDNIITNEKVMDKNLHNILEKVKDGKSGFYNFKEDGKDKYSYFYFENDWEWIIESGYYTDKINNIFSSIKKQIEKETSENENNTKLIIVIIVLVTLVLSSIILNKIKDTILVYANKTKEYVDIVDKNVITSSTDLDGNITYVSDAFCKISGYSKNELIGKKHSIVKHPDMDENIYTQMWKTISQGKVWNGEIKNLKKDGSYYWVDAIIHPNYKNNTKIGYTAIRQDITNKKKLEEISITDGLTCLYNRRYFDEMFPKAINIAKREHEYFAFILMDVDHFKLYNDTYGHQKGDTVLKEVSKSLKENLKRADDLVFRLGGEEFGVIFKTDTQDKALEYANKLRLSIEKLEIEHQENSASNYITVSMGLVCEKAEKLPEFDKIYQMADELLYKSKKNGRNQITSNLNT